MPPKPAPKSLHLLLKTHKLTIFLTVPAGTTIAALKEEALGALTSGAYDGPDVPPVSSTDDFVLCRSARAKSGSSSSSASYDLLDEDSSVREVLANWEIVYMQFKDEYGCPLFWWWHRAWPSSDDVCYERELQPIEVTLPSLLDDEEEEPRRAPPPTSDSPPASKGKRKAIPE
ncbi:hypothetical protein CONPUDRAFT_76596 [Coniophora puteana RWD-64-598 SS2]|uniref:Uncharacterized protein n=1 Tax=Coniophora puteana (strain RWD-64-598) TaxID=741705 RepID=A0A5M3MBC8_CONPW|nr:uncharacterized protein CONPUDRAFT_76596 [Coniophora puteana RWD-64-598 SS2]EIW76194.1 hypothetical protein CONPUDRAFT_76596 [Coniophora puteana RWD-64-598 SS2]